MKSLLASTQYSMQYSTQHAVHSQHVYLQEESLPWLLFAVELSEWPQFNS